MIAAGVVLLVVAACGDDDTATTTTGDRATAVAAYCAVLDGATTRSSEDTMVMLEAVTLPEISDLLDRRRRGEWTGDDPMELADFNEATCGIRWP